jgi:hypothetical protein
MIAVRRQMTLYKAINNDINSLIYFFDIYLVATINNILKLLKEPNIIYIKTT